MKIIKKINTSAALALDASGHEVVVLGKGIGFPPTPYELTDLSKVERTFYDVDPRYLSMIAELSQPIVMACADIADQAEIELGNQLNPNLPFTLADRIQFCRVLIFAVIGHDFQRHTDKVHPAEGIQVGGRVHNDLGFHTVHLQFYPSSTGARRAYSVSCEHLISFSKTCQAISSIR